MRKMVSFEFQENKQRRLKNNGEYCMILNSPQQITQNRPEVWEKNFLRKILTIFYVPGNQQANYCSKKI